MIIRLILSFIRLNFKNQYFYRFAMIGELIAILVSLTIYWFTAKAFSPAVQTQLGDYQTDFFSFILIGEIFLFLPLYLLEGFTRKIKLSIIDKTFDTFITLPVPPQKPILLLGMMGLPREVIRITVTLILASLIFQFKLPPLHFLYAMLLQICSLPVFLGIGLLMSSVIIILGRGESMLGYFNTLMAFLAGAFFPLEVLPEMVKEAGLMFSPYSALLQGTRMILAHGTHTAWFFKSFLVLGAWGLFLLPVGYYSISLAIQQMKKRGSPIIFTT